MSRRTIVSLAAFIIVGIACIATVSTDAFAYRAGVGRAGVGRAGIHHAGVHHHGAAVRRGAAVGVGAASAGVAAAGAYHAPRCGFLPPSTVLDGMRDKRA
jgi:hypothetical protein